MIASVDTSSHRCPIELVDGDAAALAQRVLHFAGTSRIFVISDDRVASLHAERLVAALGTLCGRAQLLSFPAGEANKSIATATRLWDELFDHAFDRGDTIVAVGGGVTGDLAGFVASTAMRGVRVLQVPTTVLAMCDAAIGGKTGVNVGAGKNLVGTFHHPIAVLCWMETLGTLDPRERRSGLAEAVKSALIDSPDAFAQIERDAHALGVGDEGALRRAIAMSAALKARIVSLDDREKGVRRLLNLGHTFGHAIEHASGYGAVTHGEAVASGMMAALRFGTDHGFCDTSLATRVASVLHTLGLPVAAPPMTVDAWLGPMSHDKKRDGDQINLVLCRAPGACFDHAVTLEALAAWLPALYDSPRYEA